MSERQSVTKEDLHDYWRNPTDPWEQPDEYVGSFERSAVLREHLEPHVGVDDRVLEVGCGAGANLAHLYDHGYRNLAAIELNPEMLRKFAANYRETFRATDVRRGPVEEKIGAIPADAVDATVAVAVLTHLHPSSAFVFDELVRVTSDVLVTIENERTDDDVFFPRDYADVFERRGCEQIETVDGETLTRRTELSENCVARVLEVNT